MSWACSTKVSAPYRYRDRYLPTVRSFFSERLFSFCEASTGGGL